jgi:hypothetical protein
VSEESAIEEAGIFDLEMLCLIWKDVLSDDLQKIERQIEGFHWATMVIKYDLQSCEEFGFLSNIAKCHYRIRKE